MLTWNIAPGYQHTFSPRVLLTVNPYIRKDQFIYYPSSNVFADTPATQSQDRHLLNYGIRSDLSLTEGRHNLKVGIDLKQTRLYEEFGLGITDPAFNPVCVDSNGSAAGPNTVTDPNACAGLGFNANPNFSPGLLPYDLTRGGSLFHFQGSANVNQYAFYVQDAITFGNLLVNVGLRADVYRGLVSDNGVEPRLGLSYNVKKTGTVLRAAYARTFETPYNENLILSSATGTGGLAQNVFGATGVAPLHPGRRNQFNTGFQQTIGKWLLGRCRLLLEIHAQRLRFQHAAEYDDYLPDRLAQFQAGRRHRPRQHRRHPRVSGLLDVWPQPGALFPTRSRRTAARRTPPGVFRIDHDQAFQSTANFRYQRPRNAEWISLIWRYDSGLVVSGVPDAGAALALTPNQQVSIGLACNGVFATVANPLTDCTNSNGMMGTVTSKLITLPQGGYGPFPESGAGRP